MATNPNDKKALQDFMSLVFPDQQAIPYAPGIMESPLLEQEDDNSNPPPMTPQELVKASVSSPALNQPAQEMMKNQVQATASSKLSSPIAPSSKAPVEAPQGFRDDILTQLQDAREANKQAVNEARAKDERVALLNNLNKAFGQMGTGIANQAGFTKIASNPLEVASDLAKQAGLDSEDRLAGLNEAYKIKSDKEKTATDREDKAFDRRMKQESLDIERKKLYASLLKERGEGKLSEGQKAVDKGYAKAYNDFTGGGESKAYNAIEKLKELRDEVEKESKSLLSAGGGTIAGSLPDWMRTTKSVALRDNAVSVANQGLKATFGAQLSDSEREAAAKEFYNDKLPPKENLKVMDRKIKELENSLKDEKAKAQYFQKNESLSGFAPNAASFSNGSQEPQTKVVNGKTYKKVAGGWEEI